MGIEPSTSENIKYVPQTTRQTGFYFYNKARYNYIIKVFKKSNLFRIKLTLFFRLFLRSSCASLPTKYIL